MAYFEPYIDETGIHIPSYQEILDYLITQAKTIFGNDIYLENDSMDYQMISIEAKLYYDAMNALVIEYNQRSPRSAIGAALSSLVLLNGITRNAGTYSTCTLLITGDNGTTINNGVVKDVNGYNWYLPAIVDIITGGQVYVTATCAIVGAISALVGEINQIVTPTAGWTSVTNEVIANIGTDIESNAALRARQKISTALPSRTVLNGITASILDLDGVIRARVYENDTNSTDSDGLPAHSIAAVVDGGNQGEIADAIFYKKGPGCYTHGDVLTDIVDVYGLTTTIRYFEAIYVSIEVQVNLKALNGYTSAYEDLIKQSIVDYLNGLQIGEDVLNSSIWQASLSENSLTNPVYAITSVTASRDGDPLSANDIIIDFNEVSQGLLVNVTVVVT